ncbi:MAG: leucine--tRNA ligase [Chlamydiae bacterium]|nr:leucine--tRNA ligase [Chlamydiota bacterium]
MERPKYDHQRIEQKWQKFWEDHQTFRTEVDLEKPKYYILDMFPYPSGAGLHVGHVTGYTATDILARYKRQKGFNVLHPMGWDSFGLPAEQYAIRTGTHPSITTETNINTYRRQLKSLGFSYDWSREIATSDPKYYKWTQWIFTKLYEKGLAYEAEVMVNFCPALGTVLANEEVEDGKSKEGGYPIERRPLCQWILKITAYADRLLEDLALLDWPDSLKKLQANWIGKSEGAKIHFTECKTGKHITVFTTCAHTLFGVSYVVLAPEHPFIDQMVSEEQREVVNEYRRAIASKSDLERTDLNKDKTGVWTGAYALNPVNGEKVPVWISDYVLIHYGTGAVMGVPAHDERDFEFAKKFKLPVKVIIDPLLNFSDDIPVEMSKEDVRMQVLSGHRCWSSEEGVLRESHEFNGLSIPAAKKAITEYLVAQESGEVCINYKIRDWLFSRQRYWGEPFPILHLEDGSKRVLDIGELPLCPPTMSDFKPSPDGRSPLAKVSEWVNIVDPKTGKLAMRETNTMPQWAGSCWYYLRFCDPCNDKMAWDQDIEKYWMPVDMYVGGVEHAVLHLLYARFWHKVLFDAGLVSTSEPFKTLRNQGLVIAKAYKRESGGYVAAEEVREDENSYFHTGTGEKLHMQIEKMSKSKLNGVTPDEMVEEYGADSLRLYEMFMGPFDKEKLWNTDAVNGCKRFLNRVYEMVYSTKVSEDTTEEALKLGYRVAYHVEKDIEAMQYNTAIAKMMEFMNAMTALPLYPKKVLRMFVQALYPFAPHIAEEAWEHLGGKEGISFVAYPTIEPRYLVDDTALYVVQVNGRVRGKWELPKDKTQEEILLFIKDQPNIAKHLGEAVVQKVIFVPNKLINIVVS